MIREIQKRSFTFQHTKTRIEKAILGNEAGLFGAAYLPFQARDLIIAFDHKPVSGIDDLHHDLVADYLDAEIEHRQSSGRRHALGGGQGTWAFYTIFIFGTAILEFSWESKSRQEVAPASYIDESGLPQIAWIPQMVKSREGPPNRWRPAMNLRTCSRLFGLPPGTARSSR